MSLGEVIKHARENRGLSIRALATAVGVSSGFLTRIEHDQANPTWSTIERIAEALNMSATLRLTATEDEVAAATAMVQRLSPMHRLLRQPVPPYWALMRFLEFEVPFVVVGAVAGILQGLPTPVHEMQVLVHDEEHSLEVLEDMLLKEHRLFELVGPEWLRQNSGRSWAIQDCDVTITLVPELPPSVNVEVDGYPIRVLPLAELLDDPQVKDTLGIMRSSVL